MNDPRFQVAIMAKPVPPSTNAEQLRTRFAGGGVSPSPPPDDPCPFFDLVRTEADACIIVFTEDGDDVALERA